MSVLIDGLVVSRDARGFLRATAPAEVSFQWLLAAIDSLAALTNGSPNRRMLLDLMAISNPPGLVEQTILGEHLARTLAHCVRVASLVAEGTRSGVSEEVANRFGLLFKVFTSELEAMSWLLT